MRTGWWNHTMVAWRAGGVTSAGAGWSIWKNTSTALASAFLS